MHRLAAVLILALIASPARADVYSNTFLRAEAPQITLSLDKTTASVSVTLANTTEAPYSIVFLSASLKDNRGHFFDPAARPTGIVTGKRYTCQGGVALAPGTSLKIDFTFRVSPPAVADTPVLNFVAEFQAQRASCENFSVNLPNLRVNAK